MLVGDEAEAGGAVGEGGDRKWGRPSCRRRDDGIDAALAGLAVALEIGAHLADEFAGAVGAGLEGIGDLLRWSRRRCGARLRR